VDFAGIVLIASALTAVITLMVAILALAHSISATKEARQSAARERRLTFELGLLAEISRQYALTGTFQHVAGHLRALVTPDFHELEVLRAAARVSPSHKGEQRLGDLEAQAQTMATATDLTVQDAKRELIRSAVNNEIVSAIQRRQTYTGSTNRDPGVTKGRGRSRE
jgi:hypothetical protein